MQVERKPHNDLQAGPADPLLGVHVLSQFVFCPRAGVCSYETRGETGDEEPLPAQLDFRPQYEIHDIEAAISECVSVLTWYTSGLLLIVAGGFFLAMKFAPLLLWGLIFVAVGYSGLMLPTMTLLCELCRRHRAFVRARAAEPDPDCEEAQNVNWFSLLKAGFMSVPYHRLTHDNWKLEGKPWRILRRGNLRIPVFFQTATDQRIHPKHLAKAAAYCHLIQAVEGYDSPYAVVLKEGSVEGLAIPNNGRSRRVFYEALRLARKTLASPAEFKGTSAPEQTSLCAGCPFGKPYRYNPGLSDAVQSRLSLPIVVL